jgi:hypothetical protein
MTDYTVVKDAFDKVGIDYLTDAWVSSPSYSYMVYAIPKNIEPEIAMKIEAGGALFLFDHDLMYVGEVTTFCDADGVSEYHFDPKEEWLVKQRGGTTEP